MRTGGCGFAGLSRENWRGAEARRKTRRSREEGAAKSGIHAFAGQRKRRKKSELRTDGKLMHAPPMRRSRLEMGKLQVRACWDGQADPEGACPYENGRLRVCRIE